MTPIMFDRPPQFCSKGRSGFITTAGLGICDKGVGEFAEIHLHPITTRGQPSEACRITVRKSAIPDLIAALQQFLCEHCGERAATRDLEDDTYAELAGPPTRVCEPCAEAAWERQSFDCRSGGAAEPPRFAETWCSQCGKSLGPGNSGTSHCDQHK